MFGRFWRTFFITLGICLFVLPVAADVPPPADYSVRITNPLNIARPDTIVDVPVPPRIGAQVKDWAAYVRGRWQPAQYIAETMAVRFVMTLAPGETLTVRLSANALPPRRPQVQSVLIVREGGKLKKNVLQGGTFVPKSFYRVPKRHFIHDGLIALQGFGWESDRVGYRLFLDKRNIPDLLGKYGPNMVLHQVGQDQEDIMFPQAWGGDVYVVGDTLGLGGIGLLRGGHATQIGPARLSASVIANGPVTAISEVRADGVGGGGFIHARYSLSASGVMTHVSVLTGHLSYPLIAGLAIHEGDQILIDSQVGCGDGWHYFGVWGHQARGPDLVGTAVFYPTGQVVGTPVRDKDTLYIRFARAQTARYAFTGRWSEEGKRIPHARPIETQQAFEAWLKQSCKRMNAPVKVQLMTKAAHSEP